MFTQNWVPANTIILAALICVFVPRLVPAQSSWQVEWEKNARGGAKRRNGRCGDTAERGVEKAIGRGFQAQVRDRDGARRRPRHAECEPSRFGIQRRSEIF